MGFLDYFLKKREKRKIKLKDVKDFTQEKLNELEEDITINNNEIRSKKKIIKQLLEELEEKGLQSPEIVPQRAQTIFYDNKKQYINKTNHFLQTINPPEDLIKHEEHLQEIIKGLEQLEEDTKRNYFIVKEFLQTDMNKIAKKLQEMEKNCVGGINSLKQKNFDLLKEIHELLQVYDEQLEEQKRCREDIEKIEQYKLDLYSKKDVYLDKIKAIKKSPHYAEHEKIGKQLKEREEEYKKERKKAEALFSEIEAAVKKYSKKTPTILTKAYDDVVIATKKAELFKELEKLSKKIDELDLKKTKKEKTLKTIERISKHDFSKLHELSEEYETLKKRANNNSSILNIKEIQGRIDQLDQSIKIENKKIYDIHQKIERINPKLTKQRIRDHIKTIDEYTELEI